MPQLSEDEITEKGKELAAAEVKLGDITLRFVAKRTKHNAEVKVLEARISKLSQDINSGYAADVQDPLPGVGSGPDNPTTLEESAGNAERFLDGLRDPEKDDDEDDAFSEYRRKGWDAYHANPGIKKNPYTGVGEIEARKRAAFDEGWDTAKDEATGGGEEATS